ncbi:MAG: hypothetical protein WCJ61_06750 [Paludibacter sp.]
MKSFIIKLLCFVGIPFVLILGLYLSSNPFKNVGAFSTKDTNATNREYVSTELYLKNKSTQHYNSFVFGSSRACNINTYQWKTHLPEGSNQFLFQAWSETITGISQKVDYLDENKVEIKNALVLLEIPGTFSNTQQPTTVLHIKHYLMSGETQLGYHSVFFSAILKPSELYKLSRQLFGKSIPDTISIDTLSNDWNKLNKENWSVKPKQDSTTTSKSMFFLDKSKFPKNRPTTEQYASKLINNDFESILKNIKSKFDIHKTNYKIIITPDYSQLHINKEDLLLLQEIFGKQNVFNYSGKNKITEDQYNFRDPGHFDACVGWQIIDEVYNK